MHRRNFIQICFALILLMTGMPASLSQAVEIPIESVSIGADLTLQLENMQSGDSSFDLRVSPYTHPDDSTHIYWMLAGVFEDAPVLENSIGTFPARAIDLAADLSFQVKDLNVGGVYYNMDILNIPNAYDDDNLFWMLGDMRVIENLPAVQSVKSPLALNSAHMTLGVSGTAIQVAGAVGAFMDVNTQAAADCSGMRLRVQTSSGSWDLPLQPDCSFQGTAYGNAGMSLQLVLAHGGGDSFLGKLIIPADETVTAGSLYAARYEFKGIAGLAPDHEYRFCEIPKTQTGCITDLSGLPCSAVTSDASGNLRLALEKGKQYQLMVEPESIAGCMTVTAASAQEEYVIDQRIDYSEQMVNQIVADQPSGKQLIIPQMPASAGIQSGVAKTGPETGDGIALMIDRLHFFAYSPNTLSRFPTCWWDWPFSVYTWHGLKSRAVADMVLPGHEWMDVTAAVSPWVNAEADAVVALVSDPNVTNCYAPAQIPCTCQIDQNSVQFNPASALDAYSLFFKKGDAVAFLAEGGALFYEVYDMKYSLAKQLATIHITGDMSCLLSQDHYADYGNEGPEGYEQQWAFEAFNPSDSGIAYFFQFPLLDYTSKISISGAQDFLGQYVAGVNGPYDYYMRFNMSLYVPQGP